MCWHVLSVHHSGNFIVIAGTTMAVTGMTFAGVRYPWTSAKVLVPLILGLGFVGLFILYEGKIPKEPSIPWEVLSNRTTLSGFAATFFHGITSISAICTCILCGLSVGFLSHIVPRLPSNLLPSMPWCIAYPIRC